MRAHERHVVTREQQRNQAIYLGEAVLCVDDQQTCLATATLQLHDRCFSAGHRDVRLQCSVPSPTTTSLRFTSGRRGGVSGRDGEAMVGAAARIASVTVSVSVTP